MLIRWASDQERKSYSYDSGKYGLYDVLVAVDRMSGNCLGHVGLNRVEDKIDALTIRDTRREENVKEKLSRCARNQIERKGQSFHYRFPSYAAEAEESGCPCCKALPMPEGYLDIAELEHSWITVSPQAQGRLFGKCHVIAKRHNVLFYDMPEKEMIGFISDVQKSARALHRVTEAVKINYEIHGNSGAHIHCHLFPRYLDDDFPSAPIDYRLSEPSPYESHEEFMWFVAEMRRHLQQSI